MPRKGVVDTESSIAKRIKEGRGQGAGKDYKPWLRVQDVPSDGRSHRIYSYKTGRPHHLFSDIEKNVFLSLNWSRSVQDIREQYPLQLDDTLAIAEQFGIKHPAEKGVNVVMSSDFLVNIDRKDSKVFVLQVKHSDALKDKRTIEKLEIERRYWQGKRIPWLLVTERDIDPIIKKNIEWLSPELTGEPVEEELLTTLQLLISQFNNFPQMKFIDVCKKFDSAYDSELGTSLRDIRRLMASGLINFDLTKDFRRLKSSELSVSYHGERRRTLDVANQ